MTGAEVFIMFVSLAMGITLSDHRDSLWFRASIAFVFGGVLHLTMTGLRHYEVIL